MTPAKRRPATPASQGPKRAAPAPEEPPVADPPPTQRGRLPDVPSAPPRRRRPVSDELVTDPVPPAATNDGSELLGPDGEPIAEEAPGDAGRGPGVPADTGQAAREDGATTQSPARPLALYPLPVWPD